MTDALYLSDPRKLRFEATVGRSLADRVVLDRTCFYPTGGGQPHDTGTLRAGDREWRVTDVTGREEIAHHVAGDPPPTGTTVVGAVDPDRRRAHSRYHTAQHLLSAFLLAEFDAPTRGNQLYADRARLDCAHDRFTDADLDQIEAGLNDLVAAELPVRWHVHDRETAETVLDPERTRLDLIPESVTEIRIVEIGPAEDPYDRTACAGTHVETTAEIGTVELTGRESAGSGEERVRFVLSAPSD